MPQPLELPERARIIFDIIKGRRSIRDFEPRDIPQEYLRLILEAGIWAPSGGNLQPWEFILIKKKDLIEKVKLISPGLFGDPTAPIGGHVVAHASDIRITMRKKKDDKREAKIQDCAWLPSNAAEFYITSKGISDVEEKKKDDKKKDETEEVAGVSPVKEGLEAVAQSKKAKKAEKLSSPPPEEGEEPQVASSQPVKAATAASEEAKVEHEEKAPIKKSATKKKAPKASAKKSKVPA